jgi:hypothetical protein
MVGGMTGLHWAVVGGRLDIIKLFLKRKAPLEVKNRHGGTVLDQALWAAAHSDPVNHWPETDTDWAAIIETLIAAGADVNAYPGMKEKIDELLRRLRNNVGS